MYITTNSKMQKIMIVWKCDICGSTDIAEYEALGKKCMSCGHSENIDEMESIGSKIRVLQFPGTIATK